MTDAVRQPEEVALTASIKAFAKAAGFPKPSGDEIVNGPLVSIEKGTLRISFTGKFHGEKRRNPVQQTFPQQAASFQHAIYTQVLDTVPVGTKTLTRDGQMIRRGDFEGFEGTTSFELDAAAFGGIQSLTEKFSTAAENLSAPETNRFRDALKAKRAAPPSQTSR